MINKIIAVYCIIDDVLKAIDHQEHEQRTMSDAEIITTAIASAMFFGGNHETAREYMKNHGLVPKMLCKSRFNRRLHAIDELINDLFHQLGMMLKQINQDTQYLVDSFPVSVCDNIRISRCRLVNAPEYRGYIASKRRYFYGVRVHLLTTADGIPVEMVFLPGSAHDLRGLQTLPLNLPPQSEIYGDKAYNNYLLEDLLASCDELSLQVYRKNNSRRPDPAYIAYVKQTTRHYIETVFSLITRKFPKSIHAVTLKGFLLKIQTFVFSFTLDKAFL
jgi:hypothetical protein